MLIATSSWEENLCKTRREENTGGARFTKEQWGRHMLEGGLIEGAPPPVTNGTPKRESDQTPRKYYTLEK